MLEHPSVEFEKKDTSQKAIFVIAVLTLLFLALVAVGMGLIISYDPERYQLTDNVAHPNYPEYQVERRFPEPRLQPLPSRDMQLYRNQQTQLLSSYAWIDDTAGIVRIPISVAKEIYLRDQRKEKRENAPTDHQPGDQHDHQ